LDSGGLTETAYPVAFSYDAASKALVIAPSAAVNGLWANNKYYRVVMTPGIKSLAGNQLDGNGNGIAESAEFDSGSWAFFTGTPVANYLNLFSLRLSTLNATFYDNGSGTTTTASFVGLGAGLGRINAALPVTVTAYFNQVLDPSSVYAATTALNANVAFTDSTGAVVAPTSVTLTANNQTLQIYFASLAPNMLYQLVFKGGLTGLRGSQEPWRPLLRGAYFDGNNLCGAEAADNSKPRYLQTCRADGSVATAPYANNSDVTYNAGSSFRRWEIVFHAPSSGIMDASTLTSGNLILYSGNSPAFTTNNSGANILNVIPAKDIVYDATVNTAYVYMPDTFVASSSDTIGGYFAYVKVMVTHNVKSTDGLSFDGSGDGVGSGTPSDDHLYGDANSGNLAPRIYKPF
jgi:hypothetical protein